MTRYPNMLQALAKLKKRGFKDEFRFEDHRLKNLSNGAAYLQNQLMIVEHHRFEGMSNPSDMSILLALETEDGRKGTIVSSYGPYADLKLVDFLDKVKIKSEHINA
jgi:hypothetical protein